MHRIHSRGKENLYSISPKAQHVPRDMNDPKSASLDGLYTHSLQLVGTEALTSALARGGGGCDGAD